MTDHLTQLDKEIDYIHDRIDQVIRQTALEVGLLRLHAGLDPCERMAHLGHEIGDHSMDLTLQRFWAADDAAAERAGRDPREH